MCDYSLHATASRPAKAGDQLISTSFKGSITRGFAAEAGREVAVCLMPGTELAFAQEVKFYRHWFWPAKTGFSVAKFCKLPASRDELHQDALEFPDGQTVLLTNLVKGQRARVLQVPPPARQDDRSNIDNRSATPVKTLA